MKDDDEDIVLLRAILDVNIPKFTINDIPLFENIISDLFPGLTMPPRSYGSLLEALHEVMEENHLIPEPDFTKKCIQLYDTMMVRHGLMLVGDAMCGKTTV